MKERLLAYRMVKKVEPEALPLVRTPGYRLPVIKALSEEDDIMERNATCEAMNKWRPEVQSQERLRKKEQRAARMRNVLETADAQLAVSQRLKKQQSEHHMRTIEKPEEESRTIQMNKGKNDFAIAWFSSIYMIGFMTTLHEELQIKKMNAGDMLKFVGKHISELSHTPKLKEDHALQRAITVNIGLENKKAKNSLSLMTAMLRYRKKLRQERQKAAVILTSLQCWKLSGRTMKLMLRYRLHIITIQRWWREQLQIVRDNEELVRRRWMKLEREHLRSEALRLAAAEAAKLENPFDAGSPTTNSSNNDRPTLLKQRTNAHRAPEVKVKLMDNSLRKRFIENELRARRYLVLPSISNWEEEMHMWRKDMRDWLTKKTLMPIYPWPPPRPYYMPPSHTTHEEGKPCCDACPGKRGDQEILDMYMRCKQDPMSWKERLESHTRSGRALEGSDDEEEGVFGPAPTLQDYMNLGAMEDLPGVHIKRMMGARTSAALHGGEAKAWLSQMACASSAGSVGFRPGTAELNAMTTSPTGWNPRGSLLQSRQAS